MSTKSESFSHGSDHSKPIHLDEMLHMVKNYKETNVSGDDTESAWFGVKELLALINHNKANGIRIYYGRHDKDDKLYPGRHNVILVATNDPDNLENPRCENSQNLLHPHKAGDTDPHLPFSGMALEWSALCPPRCNPDLTLM